MSEVWLFRSKKQLRGKPCPKRKGYELHGLKGEMVIAKPGTFWLYTTVRGDIVERTWVLKVNGKEIILYKEYLHARNLP